MCKAARERGESDREVVYYRPEREAQVLRRIIERDSGPLDGSTVAHVFREIMSACLALERPLQVAYLGPEGTFTQAAALKHFGHAAVCVPQVTIDGGVFRGRVRHCNYGIVPVENSTEGMVSHTLDTFLDSPLKIAGEVEMRISHHLLAAPGTDAGTGDAYLRAPAGAGAVPQLAGHALAALSSASRRSAATAKRRGAPLEPGVAAVAGDMAAEAYEAGPARRAYRGRSRTTPRAFLSSVAARCRPAGTTRHPSWCPAATSPARCLPCWILSGAMASA
jgi:chorismate mutase/prephenate dehydratase